MPSSFPKADISKFPRPIQAVPLNLTLACHFSHQALETPCSKSKPKRGHEPPVVSELGPATMQFIAAHDLTHIMPVLALIIQHNPAPQWSTLIMGLSLCDEDHNSLVDALTNDWLEWP
jgi:hypothetical protein